MKYSHFLFLASLTVLVGCQSGSLIQSGPVTQSQIDSTPTWYENAHVTEARRCTKEFGYTYGTPAYGNCLMELERRRLEAANALTPLTQQLLEAGKWQTYGSPDMNVPSGSTTPGYLTGQTNSGQLIYCTYSNSMILTVPRTEICPSNM
jgi:hypothetical protein